MKDRRLAIFLGALLLAIVPLKAGVAQNAAVAPPPVAATVAPPLPPSVAPEPAVSPSPAPASVIDPALSVPASAAPPPPPSVAEGRMLLPLDALTPEGTIVPAEILAQRSLMFTQPEITAVVNALLRAGRRAANRPDSASSGPDSNGVLPGMEGYIEPETEAAAPSYPPIPTRRTITLSGVLYRKPGDWVVWMNGHKLVPGQLLPEIVAMNVERDRVNLKWFDIGIGKVITLTLRPHQTYDVTSGLLLSGERFE